MALSSRTRRSMRGYGTIVACSDVEIKLAGTPELSAGVPRLAANRTRCVSINGVFNTTGMPRWRNARMDVMDFACDPGTPVTHRALSDSPNRYCNTTERGWIDSIKSSNSSSRRVRLLIKLTTQFPLLKMTKQITGFFAYEKLAAGQL